MAWIIILLCRVASSSDHKKIVQQVRFQLESRVRIVELESEFMIIPDWPSYPRTDLLIDILVPSASLFLSRVEWIVILKASIIRSGESKSGLN